MSADLSSLIESDPERMGGEVCFAGTRVPLRNLFDYLATGHSLQEFLDDFPGAGRDRTIAILDAANDLLTAQAHDRAQHARHSRAVTRSSR
jgi:uncharacterized protein (DUF433 family)